MTIGLLSDCGNHENEFWTHVSSQDELPIADAGLSETKERADSDTNSEDGKELKGNSLVAALNSLADRFDPHDTSKLQAYIVAQILESPELINQLRLLISVSNKRLYLDLSYIFSRTLHPADATKTLCGCAPHKLRRHGTSFFVKIISKAKKDSSRAASSAVLIADYLLNKGLIDILRVYSSLSKEERDVIVRYLIAPKEAQQNEAKRRGHGPEAKLAKLVRSLGVSFAPKDKDTRPMGEHDPNINRETFTIVRREADKTFSSDLVILDSGGKVRVCVVGLIHSSDPGQFGVDKSDKVIDIRRSMDVFNRDAKPHKSVEIWGLVDGVGYSENKRGTIHKMLPHFHNFFQMKSLYKAALGLHRLGLTKIKAIQFDKTFYSDDSVTQMIEKYVPEEITVINDSQDVKGEWLAIEAGAAILYI